MPPHAASCLAPAIPARRWCRTVCCRFAGWLLHAGVRRVDQIYMAESRPVTRLNAFFRAALAHAQGLRRRQALPVVPAVGQQKRLPALPSLTRLPPAQQPGDAPPSPPCRVCPALCDGCVGCDRRRGGRWWPPAGHRRDWDHRASIDRALRQQQLVAGIGHVASAARLRPRHR